MKKTMFLFLLLSLGACKKNKTISTLALQAKPFITHSCQACGMILREQSAPRGQLVHQDGERYYFCSLSDMLTYIGTPSPHGEIAKVFVEKQDQQKNPLQFTTQQQSWLQANQSTFLLGVRKERVMGTPILSFEKETKAKQWKPKAGGTLVSWEHLKTEWQKLQNK